jgi:hypothetical protein
MVDMNPMQLAYFNNVVKCLTSFKPGRWRPKPVQFSTTPAGFAEDFVGLTEAFAVDIIRFSS